MAKGVVEFSREGYKIRKIFALFQHTQRNLSNLENWCSGELSKIGHHFSNKLMVSNVNFKKCAPKNIEKDSYNF